MAAVAAAPQPHAAAAAAAGANKANDPHALPVLQYHFNGPLHPVLSGDVKNDNPYSAWQQHPAYGPYMASKFLPWHMQFRDSATKMLNHLHACKAVGDAEWSAFVTLFLSTWKVLDIHHRMEDDHVFPQLDALYGPSKGGGVGDTQAAVLKAAGASLMDTPLMTAQHHALLIRTAALMAMTHADTLAKAAADVKLSAELLADTKLEYGGWRYVLLEHLRDEEQLVVPLLLLGADKIKAPPPPPGAGGGAGRPGGAPGAAPGGPVGAAGGPPGAAGAGAAGAGAAAAAHAAGGGVAAITAGVSAAKLSGGSGGGGAGAVDPHALPVVQYTFSGPLNPVLSGDVKNTNPYDQWLQSAGYGASMVPRLLPWHVQFRDAATKMAAQLSALQRVGDTHWAAFVETFTSTWKVMDIHHRIEDDTIFPQLDALFPAKGGSGGGGGGGVMDTPLMWAQHKSLLTRTSALMAMTTHADTVSRAATDRTLSAQLCSDLRVEFGGWVHVLLTHLRDEEALVVPLMLLAGDKLKPPVPPPGGFAGGGAGRGGGAGGPQPAAGVAAAAATTEAAKL